LNPLDRRCPEWNIFKEVRRDSDFDSIAAAFIPMDSSRSSDPFWIRAARGVFAAIASRLYSQGHCHYDQLQHWLFHSDLEQLASFLEGSDVQSIIDARSPKTSLSVVSVLRTYVRALRILPP
ncbi:MAG: type IV conjugative transfer system coupling protein TraD, partial [Phototrophicales bacterium]